MNILLLPGITSTITVPMLPRRSHSIPTCTTIIQQCICKINAQTNNLSFDNYSLTPTIVR
ncbi:unnamed protein product, partial [Dicrocoelium dendriticum]